MTPHPARPPLHFLRRPLWSLVVLAPLWLSGCDLLGIEPASLIAERKDAENKAIGAGCRHAARSVEQCFELNRRADKAAVFAGWKEMNDYMRENNIEAVPALPEREPVELADAKPAAAAAAAEDKAAPAKAAPGKAAPPKVPSAEEAAAPARAR